MGRGRADGSAPAREELLKLQVGQWVRVRISGRYAAGRGKHFRVDNSWIARVMLENPDALQWKQHVVLIVRGYIRKVGKKGALTLTTAGGSASSSLASDQIIHVEVLGDRTVQ